MAAEDMKEIALYASWHAANTMTRYRDDAHRDESKVRRHYDSLCSSGVFSNEFCSVYEQMAWAAAWIAANERFGTKKDAGWMLWRKYKYIAATVVDVSIVILDIIKPY